MILDIVAEMAECGEIRIYAEKYVSPSIYLFLAFKQQLKICHF